MIKFFKENWYTVLAGIVCIFVICTVIIKLFDSIECKNKICKNELKPAYISSQCICLEYAE